ncbi:MAG: tRNA (guanosine(37)-N1)-methyltransferase TrmD [Pseudomonadota bacterium]
MAEAAAEPTRAPWRATVATLFPAMFPGPLGFSLVGRALEAGLWRLNTLDFRDFSSDKHRSVDAPPTGGGPGLVMRPDIVAAAVDRARRDDAAEGLETARPALFLSPRGRPFSQAWARALADGAGAVLLCGRFEGADARALEARGVEEVSVGDAVLTGGEVPAMALIEAADRLLPGVIGDPASLEEESFAAGLLEHPQYTRPAVWEGRAAPEVLRSGDHARVRAWRRAEAERTTRERRPDLWRAHLEQGAASALDESAPRAPLEQSDADNGPGGAVGGPQTRRDDAI